MRFLAVSIAALVLAAAALGLQAPAPKKKAATPASGKTKAVPHAAASKIGNAKKSDPKSTATKSAASRSAVSKTGSRTGTNARKTVARRPPTQQQPTADRYKEIQQALVEKGYFQGPVDGAWNAGSVDALKRFQKDQNLDADGKIGSLSLIALGLGPKRSAALAQPPLSGGEPVEPPPVAQPQR